MKKLFFCAAALLAAISFSACSDDDETNLPITPDAIVGTWQITRDQGWEIYGGEKESWSDKYPDEEGFYWMYTFDKNGAGRYSECQSGKTLTVNNVTYSISDNKITIRFDKDDSSIYEIKKLTESQLVLFASESDSDGSREAEYIQTYKRIK